MKPQKPRAGLFGGLRNAFSQRGLAQRNNAGVSRGELLGSMLMSLAGPQQAMMAQQNLMGIRQDHRDMMREQQERQGLQNTAQKQAMQRRQTAMDRGYSPELADMYAQDPESFFGVVSQNYEAANVSPGATRVGGAFGENYTAPELVRQNGVYGTQTVDGFQQTGQDALVREGMTADVASTRAGTRNTLDQVRSRREGDALAQAEFDREANAAPWDDVNSLRGDAEGDLNRIRFREVESSFQRVVDSAREPSAAGDLALIFNYMKMLDPGSTVREGEFANAQNAGGASARARAAYNSILDGTRLTDEQRSDFLGRAEQLYQGQRQIAEQRLAPYQEQAQQRFGEQYQPYAVPQLLDVGGRGQGASRENPASMPAQVGAEYNRAYADLPSGAYYTHPDGTVRRKR